MEPKGLDRDAIARAALALLDEVGLDGLTVRRLAAELGVKSPALYWHFRSKQELLNEMTRTLLAPSMGGPRDGETWQAWFTRRARGYRQMLASHRDCVRLVTGSHPGHTIARRFEEELQILIHYGFTPGQGLHAVATMSAYVTGFVLAEQGHLERRAHSGSEDLGDLEAFPAVVAAIRESGALNSGEAFDHGLGLLIAGMATLDEPRSSNLDPTI